LANDVTLNPGVGGKTMSTSDMSAGPFAYSLVNQAPTCVIYFSPDTSTAPTPLTTAHPMPVAVQAGSATMGAVTQASGPWTQNLTQVGSSSLTLGQKAMASSVPVVLASDQAAIPVSQSGTWNATINTALPAGGATIGAVTQASGPWTVNVTQIGSSALAFGQANMASSIPVVLASNQTAVPASQSGTWTVQPGNTQNTTPWLAQLHDGTNKQGTFFDLDTGAGTEWQPGVTVRISASGGSVEAKGQKAMASSIPVAIASDQGAFPVSQSGSNWTQNLVQVNGTTIDTNSGSKSGGTVRVVLATDQPVMSNAQPVSQSGTWALGNLEAGLSAGTAPNKMTVTGAQYNTTTPAATNAQTVANQCDPSGGLYVQPCGRLATYLFSSNLFSTAASATDIAIFEGSATKVCKLKKIRLWLYGSGVYPGNAQVNLVTRSTKDTAGSTAGGSSQYDPNDGAPTAAPIAYTANPSLGTGVATILAFLAYPMSTHATPTAGTLSPSQGYYEIDFTIPGTEPLVFRDANHGVAVNLNAATITGGQAAVQFIWTEE
jgi:hypothetical protein